MDDSHMGSGHLGVEGSERVDGVTRREAASSLPGPEPILLIHLNHANTIIAN